MGNRQTGRAAADDDKVILVPELRHLPLGQDLVAAGESLDGAEQQRADGEGVGETHLCRLGNKTKGLLGGLYGESEYPNFEEDATLEEVDRTRRRVRSEKKGSSSFL